MTNDTLKMTEKVTVNVIYRDVDYFTEEKKGEDKTFKLDFKFNKNDSTIDRLEQVWREMNVVDGNETPVQLKVRSMMVHDRVEMNNEIYQVASLGWINAETGESIE